MSIPGSTIDSIYLFKQISTNLFNCVLVTLYGSMATLSEHFLSQACLRATETWAKNILMSFLNTSVQCLKSSMANSFCEMVRISSDVRSSSSRHGKLARTLSYMRLNSTGFPFPGNDQRMNIIMEKIRRYE